MQQHSAQKRHPAHAFVEAFREDPEHHHDVELLIPLAAGAGIIYVVDGSRPMRKNDVCEMEILRMTGNPRMALINPKEGDDSFLQTWKENCAKSFNLTRIFNAHHASFVERMALLESLKRMHQDWEPAMLRAVGIFERDWKKGFLIRLKSSATASLKHSNFRLRCSLRRERMKQFCAQN